MKNDIQKKRIATFTRKARSSNLFVAGFCPNPDDDQQELNLRMFEHDGKSVALLFTSLAKMRRFFNAENLTGLKYMIVTPPDHLEAVQACGNGALVDPGSPSEIHLTPGDVDAILLDFDKPL